MMTFDPQLYRDMDAAALAAHQVKNEQRTSANSREIYRLRPDIGPHPFDGDIRTASVVLLMANPSHDHTSTLRDHTFTAPGWPMSSLHPNASSGMFDYVAPKVKELVAHFGAQHVAQHVCMLQIHPWASKRFDDSFTCPSMTLAVQQAKDARARGALLVMGRKFDYWQQALGGDPLPFVSSRLNPSLNRQSLRLHEGLFDDICDRLNGVLAGAV